MADSTNLRPGQVDGSRKRNLSFFASTDEEARKAVIELNSKEEQSDKKEEDKKTYGRTPDGTGMFLTGYRDNVPGVPAFLRSWKFHHDALSTDSP